MYKEKRDQLQSIAENLRRDAEMVKNQSKRDEMIYNAEQREKTVELINEKLKDKDIDMKKETVLHRVNKCGKNLFK